MSLRTIGAAVVAISSVLLLSVSSARTQSAAESGLIMFAPNVARTVAVSKDGDVLMSFTVPRGAFLGVSYDDRQPHVIREGHWEFHGDIAVRLQPASAAPRLTGKKLEQTVLEAPLVLTGQGMDVTVDNGQ